jgi:hypothetical protein
MEPMGGSDSCTGCCYRAGRDKDAIMTNRPRAAGLVAEFLRDAFAGGALGVPKLEVMARAAGLLGEGQRITHAKVFKRAKKFLGIRSVRNGFGDGGEWLWLPEKQPGPPAREPSAQLLAGPASIADAYAEADDRKGDRRRRSRRRASSTVHARLISQCSRPP